MREQIPDLGEGTVISTKGRNTYMEKMCIIVGYKENINFFLPYSPSDLLICSSIRNVLTPQSSPIEILPIPRPEDFSKSLSYNKILSKFLPHCILKKFF